MKHPRHIALTFVCSLLLLTSACGAKPTASPLTGALSELSGLVNAKQASETDFHPVAAGEVLQVAGQVQTGDDGRARVDLSSGTIIRVAPTSLFTLASNEPVQGGLFTKLKLELGRIYVILNGGSLDVETPSGVASVLGSYMMVEITPGTLNIVITCLEGNCSAGGINFTNGQKITFFYDLATGQYGPPLLEEMNEKDFQNWRDESPEARSILDRVLAALPTDTSTPTPIPPSATSTSTPTGTPTPENACFKLLTPLNDIILNKTGLVTFSWEPQAEAEKYQIIFTSPSGAQNILETTFTSLTDYIEFLQIGGLYSWQVTALNANGETICTSSAFSFSKPDSPTLVPTRPKPDVRRPTKVPPTPTEVVCTIDNQQWENPDLPCYCDPNLSVDNPPYCTNGPY
jgi:hypothetical protein